MDPFLLVLIGVAAFIIFRLVSVLGTRTGHEPQRDYKPGAEKAEAKRAADPTDAYERGRGDEDERDRARPEPVSSNERLLREADQRFDEEEFLAGARQAYEMIIEAFVGGDLRSIRPYLDDSVYEAFKSAVMAREQAGHTEEVQFVGVERASLIDAGVEGGFMRAVVEFSSNQVRMTRDADGEIVAGDPNRIDLVRDRWTFSRRADAADPNWLLVATGGSA